METHAGTLGQPRSMDGPVTAHERTQIIHRATAGFDFGCEIERYHLLNGVPRGQGPSPAELAGVELVSLMRGIHAELDQTHRAPRMAEELARRATVVTTGVSNG